MGEEKAEYKLCDAMVIPGFLEPRHMGFGTPNRGRRWRLLIRSQHTQTGNGRSCRYIHSQIAVLDLPIIQERRIIRRIDDPSLLHDIVPGCQLSADF